MQVVSVQDVSLKRGRQRLAKTGFENTGTMCYHTILSLLFAKSRQSVERTASLYLIRTLELKSYQSRPCLERANLLQVFAFEEEVDSWCRGRLTFIWSTSES